MQIDSIKVHDALNAIAIECHNNDIHYPLEVISKIRKAVNDIEAETACNNAKFKYADALSGLKEK
jgi:hypothetical protein